MWQFDVLLRGFSMCACWVTTALQAIAAVLKPRLYAAGGNRAHRCGSLQGVWSCRVLCSLMVLLLVAPGAVHAMQCSLSELITCALT